MPTTNNNIKENADRLLLLLDSKSSETVDTLIKADAKEVNQVILSSTEKQIPRSILSEEEIEATVKAFLLALLRGQIKINFSTAVMTQYTEQQGGNTIDYNEAAIKQAKYKRDFNELLEICAGIQPSSSEELKSAMNKMFRQILFLRTNKRIESTFPEYEMEGRMNELEKKFEIINKVIQRLINQITEDESQNNLFDLKYFIAVAKKIEEREREGERIY
jgi:hypothetical protein